MQIRSVDTRWFQNVLADKRLSQRKLAAKLGIDPAAVSLMIRGKRKLSAAEASEIAKFLGVSVEEVMTHAGVTGTVPTKGKPNVNQSYNSSGPISVPPPPAGEMLEIPVPLSDGSLARVTVPRLLTQADAERISALVSAYAQK